MTSQRRRTVQGALSAAVGGVSVAGVGPLLRVVADPSVCLGLSPEQSWIGLHLHLISESAACAQGGYLATSSLAPVVSFTFAVSLSVLIVGLATVLISLGAGIALRRVTRRVGSWFRRWLPVPIVLLPALRPVPIPVRSQARRAQLAHLPSQRRGPPCVHC